jgi:SET family sugar efflux transporter-like MFS transporter
MDPESASSMQRLIDSARTLLAHPAFLVVLGCNILLGLASSFVAPFLSMFGTREVHMRPLIFGVFMTVTTLSGVAITTVLARWSDTHWSRRSVLLLGGVCGVLGYIGYAVVRDTLWLTVIGCTLMAVASITFAQLFAHARELLDRSVVPDEETPLYMNIFRLFFALSWTVGPAIASWVMVLYRFTGMFLVAAATFALFTAVVWAFIPAEPPPNALSSARTPLRQVLRRSDVLAYFSGFALVFTATTITMMNLPLFVIETLGGNEHHVGIIYSVAPVFELPFMFYFGVLASKGDTARVIRIGVWISLAYYAVLALVQAPWHIYLLQVLGAAATAVTAGVAITFFQNYLPGQPGTATNLYSSAQRVGSVGGYILFGVLDTSLGHRWVSGICVGLCAITLALFATQARVRPSMILETLPDAGDVPWAPGG